MCRGEQPFSGPGATLPAPTLPLAPGSLRDGCVFSNKPEGCDSLTIGIELRLSFLLSGCPLHFAD